MNTTPLIVIELTDAQAWAFAQFVKRAGLSDYRALAADQDEAAAMLCAGEVIRKALADAGWSPR